MLHKKVITSRQFNYLCPPDEPRPRRFYMLPKIHKPPSEWTIPNKMPKGPCFLNNEQTMNYSL